MESENTGSGKWTVAGVPHRNWTCVGSDDREDDLIKCEMCEARDVRFVQIMQHPDYPAALHVGKICAGHMSGDAPGALNREKRMRSLAARRPKWLARRWRISLAGNEYINTDNCNISIFRRGQGWGGLIIHKPSGYKRYSTIIHETSDAAKLAALEEVLLMLEDEPWVNR